MAVLHLQTALERGESRGARWILEIVEDSSPLDGAGAGRDLPELPSISPEK
jgi:hypothetical protein